MPCTGLQTQQLAPTNLLKQKCRPQCKAQVRTTCSVPKSAAQPHRPSPQLASSGQSLGLGAVQSDRLTRDSVAASAASPALDSSGGDLPPIDNTSKATGEYDDESNEGSSAAEIERILLKV